MPPSELQTAYAIEWVPLYDYALGVQTLCDISQIVTNKPQKDGECFGTLFRTGVTLTGM